MELLAENGVRLGELIWENDRFYLEPRGKMTEYMLEQAYIQIKKRSR